VDAKQFDELVARLASGQSRRNALKGIAGGALATVGVTSVAAGKKGRVKAEHCLPIGARCDPKQEIREGAKNKKKTHTCEGVKNKKGKIVRGCCTRVSEQVGDVRRCACVEEGGTCSENRNCCSQNCTGGLCVGYGTP